MPDLPSNAQPLKLPEAESFIALARCEVFYQGRASSKLPLGCYLIIVKKDRSVAVHDSNFKPINYQASGSAVVINNDAEFVTLTAIKKQEKLIVKIHELLMVHNLHQMTQGSLELYGTESHMVQEFLSKITDYFPDKVTTITELHTDHGPADIYLLLKGDKHIIIEAKRKTAGIAAYSQVMRYCDWLKKTYGWKVQPMILSPRIAKPALKALEEAGGKWIKFDIKQPDWSEFTLS